MGLVDQTVSVDCKAFAVQFIVFEFTYASIAVDCGLEYFLLGKGYHFRAACDFAVFELAGQLVAGRPDQPPVTLH